jgi:hypothetical protein
LKKPFKGFNNKGSRVTALRIKKATDELTKASHKLAAMKLAE